MSEVVKDKDMSTWLFTALRVSLGWVFLFAFFDRLFGLGYFYRGGYLGTPPQGSVLAGNSPTVGFLQYGTQGKWFHDFFASLAGLFIVDLLYMLGLLGIGLGMTLGVARKISAVSGTVMLMLMWLASLPLEHNPFMDDHVIYSIALLILGFTGNSGIIFIPQWKEIAEQYPILE